MTEQQCRLNAKAMGWKVEDDWDTDGNARIVFSKEDVRVIRNKDAQWHEQICDIDVYIGYIRSVFIKQVWEKEGLEFDLFFHLDQIINRYNVLIETEKAKAMASEEQFYSVKTHDLILDSQGQAYTTVGRTGFIADQSRFLSLTVAPVRGGESKTIEKEHFVKGGWSKTKYRINPQ